MPTLAAPSSTLVVALAGNPNSGKSTLFNALTGLRQKVANYPGVTVEKKTGRCQIDTDRFAEIIDLPGTYSLISRSPDELIAMEVLRGLRPDTPAPDVVVAVVDASNLQRQILHSTETVGWPKVESAAKRLNSLNPDVKVVQHKTRLNSDNVLDIIKDYDVIVDGVDNFPTRYLLNDAALKLNKPVVHASIYRFEGQLTCFIPDEGPCYRCLYPEPPPADMAPSCQEAGVVGVLPGVVGVLQATEAIKILLGLGKSMAGRLLMYDALGTKFREMKLRRDPKCPTCGEGVDRSKIELIDYEQFCAV